MIDFSLPGWMSPAELIWLYETSRHMQSIVEVGSYKGRTTHPLCKGCQGLVFTIDNFMLPFGDDMVIKDPDPTALYKEFYKNVGHFKNLVIFRTDSEVAAQFFKPKSIDMIFIDAGHEKDDLLKDLKAWLPICKKLICGHDLQPAYPGIELALKEMNINYSFVVGSIWKHEIISQ